MGVKTHILVLEDDPDLREELTDLLTEEGYAVSAAGRGEDAVRLAGEIPFDLVIADVRMDGMDGLEALERMRGQDSARMVITGYASEADSIRAIRLGVDEYLKKPFSMRDFLDRVAALLQQRRLNRERQEAERAARRLTRSALESLAGVLDGADGGARVRAGRLASLLASRLGLDREAASEVGTAALVASMGEAARIADADPRLRAVADAVEERWDGGGPEGLAGADIPLEARVTAVAVEAAERPPQAAESLAREFPGRFDPRVLEALGSITSEEPVAEADASRIRGLLSLGEALHGRGDGESARRAFRQVV
ncbi:MAG: response regulator, partial [Armatimonadetes bacterium]|nr:response regulator [Armatimonadota bacterium]